MTNRELIEKLERDHCLSKAEFIQLITTYMAKDQEYLFQRARAVREQHYGTSIFIRGLIELTNYCKNDCYYCGIRKSNQKVRRYCLKEEEILECTKRGYELGFRTFVLQGGENGGYSPSRMTALIRAMKQNHPDCAITLSVGEHSKAVYEQFYEAGADRYLLRHETANPEHYGLLHPENLSLENRLQCLRWLKEIGFQVGTGFMVGSPFQKPEYLAEDLLWIHELQPHMVGIGPFITHCDTPFRDYPSGSVELTLVMLGMLRLMLPKVLLPATTALGSLEQGGRERGILAGANVVMPNLSPPSVRGDYNLYDNKLYTGIEAAEGLEGLKNQMQKIGYQIETARGDSLIPTLK